MFGCGTLRRRLVFKRSPRIGRNSTRASSTSPSTLPSPTLQARVLTPSLKYSSEETNRRRRRRRLYNNSEDAALKEKKNFCFNLFREQLKKLDREDYFSRYKRTVENSTHCRRFVLFFLKLTFFVRNVKLKKRFGFKFRWKKNLLMRRQLANNDVTSPTLLPSYQDDDEEELNADAIAAWLERCWWTNNNDLIYAKRIYFQAPKENVIKRSFFFIHFLLHFIISRKQNLWHVFLKLLKKNLEVTNKADNRNEDLQNNSFFTTRATTSLKTIQFLRKHRDKWRKQDYYF